MVGYERLFLVQNNNLVPQKNMGYEGLWIMRGMGQLLRGVRLYIYYLNP